MAHILRHIIIHLTAQATNLLNNIIKKRRLSNGRGASSTKHANGDQGGADNRYKSMPQG